MSISSKFNAGLASFTWLESVHLLCPGVQSPRVAIQCKTIRSVTRIAVWQRSHRYLLDKQTLLSNFLQIYGNQASSQFDRVAHERNRRKSQKSVALTGAVLNVMQITQAAAVKQPKSLFANAGDV